MQLGRKVKRPPLRQIDDDALTWRFGQNVNRRDCYLAPSGGRKITIPSVYILPKAPRQGIVINLAQWRPFYFPPQLHWVEAFSVCLLPLRETTPFGSQWWG